MEYDEFTEGYKAGTIRAHVDKNAAGLMYDDPAVLPRSIRKRQAIQRLIAITGIVGGGISFFWLPWWGAGLIIIFFLASFYEIRKSAAQGVLEAALQNITIYNLAIEKKVLNVESVDDGKT